LARFAQEAGLAARLEPDTYVLLQEEFSRIECRRVFPRKFGAAYRKLFAQMIPAYQAAARARTTTDKAAAMACVRTILDSFPLSNNREMSGLRVDVAISDPETGAERWVDVSTVHTTSQSYLKAEYEDVKRRVAAAELAVEPACNPALLDPSPAVAAREKLKRDKYAILVAIAAKQTAEYKRSATPAIAPFILSDNGEMGPSANELQEWQTTAGASFGRGVRQPARIGLSPPPAPPDHDGPRGIAWHAPRAGRGFARTMNSPCMTNWRRWHVPPN
jgi:hypothetical protein